MTARHSLRSRLFWGALIGAVGTLMLGHLVFLHLIRFFPGVFRMGHMWLAATIATFLIVVGVRQANKGLSQFDHLRARLTSIREGRSTRLEGRYPAEVQPLVNDLNALLDHRHQAITRAQAKAGDLAHGLKTPLAILSREAQRAREAGHDELATSISQQVERMGKQVDYHLAQARAAASGATPGARCVLAESADALIRTLKRLYAEREIVFQQMIPPDCAVQAEREDIDEMLGNVLDNACKWAKGRIDIAALEKDSNIVITVDDDGPGLSADKRDLVLQRGVRADETAPGSGLGLGIVRDLAELHGGTVALDQSPAGGMRAILRLPRA
jgi:signal transduction histidine kinase